jgi:alpha-amylase
VISACCQTLVNVFAQKQSMNNIQSMLQSMASDFTNTNLLGNFVYVVSHLSLVRASVLDCSWRFPRDNHDNPRFLSQQSDYSLYQSALLYSMYSEGIPIVYYGSEQVGAYVCPM